MFATMLLAAWSSVPAVPPLPPAHELELMHFAPVQQIRPLWLRAKAYRDFQRDKRRMGATACIIFGDLIADAEWRERCWDRLDWAQLHRWDAEQFREDMRLLKIQLGEWAFEHGVMPVPAPAEFVAPPAPNYGNLQ